LKFEFCYLKREFCYLKLEFCYLKNEKGVLLFEIGVLLFKVTGHPFWPLTENRYCVLNICPIFIKFSPNVLQCMQNMVKL
jgi:hypothetical protein